jgi:protein-S-isoprenylcysteine O-methyltransferase Ste14
MSEKKTGEVPGRGKIALLAISRFAPMLVVLGALFFASAGDLAWGNAWIYLGTLGALMIIVLAYLLIRDPALLEKRLRTRERRSAQKRCVSTGIALIALIYVVPGLDRRFGWSSVPAAFVWIGVAALVAGYILFLAVMRANSYASRVIEVQEGQKVIDTGPYSLLRHPMYSASLVIYIASPLVLGSWWAVIPALAYLPLLAMRIRDEEAMLRRELPGYAEYCARVRWRIFPGIW